MLILVLMSKTSVYVLLCIYNMLVQPVNKYTYGGGVLENFLLIGVCDHESLEVTDVEEYGSKQGGWLVM